MLVITRAPGESLQIGESILLVERLSPVVVLVLVEDGREKRLEFTLDEVAISPAVALKQARVVLDRIQRRKLQLMIDAPRDVKVLRAELRTDAAD